MSGRLVIVSGTGTDIGKTHVAEALLLAWSEMGVRAAGLKPVESGVQDREQSDAARLQRVSSFHVKHFGYSFSDAISPHLAARRAALEIDLPNLETQIRAVRREANVTLVELPGGLFTPLTSQLLNIDFALACEPNALLLVAPDRLGVLHDVLSLEAACLARDLPQTAFALNAPPQPDTSTGTNARELGYFARSPVRAILPRASVQDIAARPDLIALGHLLRESPSVDR